MPVRKTKSMGPSPRTWYPTRSFPSLANFVVGRTAQMSLLKGLLELRRPDGMPPTSMPFQSLDRTLGPVVSNDWLYQVGDRNHTSGSQLRIPESLHSTPFPTLELTRFRGR
jgi:hypothetical protein